MKSVSVIHLISASLPDQLSQKLHLPTSVSHYLTFVMPSTPILGLEDNIRFGSDDIIE